MCTELVSKLTLLQLYNEEFLIVSASSKLNWHGVSSLSNVVLHYYCDWLIYFWQVPDIIDNAYVIVEFDNGSRGMLDLCMFAEGSKNEQEISVVGDIGKVKFNPFAIQSTYNL